MIQTLRNPKTVLYQQLKELILGSEFMWFYNSTSHTIDEKRDKEWDNFGFFSHCLLRRPGDMTTSGEIKYYATPNSEDFNPVHDVFVEIAKENGIIHSNMTDNPVVMYRANVNMCLPSETGKPLNGPPHVDHPFPHKNMLIFLTDCNGGPTVVGDDSYYAKEDEIILFEGTHRASTPTKDRRVNIVLTFHDFK